MLDARETAALIWVTVAVIAVLVFVPDIRPTVRELLRMLLGPKLLIPILAVAGWIVGVVTLASRVGLWTSGLLGDTVVTGLSVFALVAAMDRAFKQPRFLRHVLRNATAAVVFIEAFVNLRPFHIVAELVVQPVITLVAMMGVVAERDPEHRPVRRLTDAILVAFGLFVGSSVLWNLVTSWREITREDVLAFALPIWLILASLPVVYAVWLYGAYDSAFMRLDFVPADQSPPSRRVRFRSRLALVLAFGGRVRDAGSFPAYAAARVRQAPSLRAAVAAARGMRSERLAQEAAEAAKEERLVNNAGVVGTDAEGGQLDQREFDATREALRWIATCHMGWYSRDSRYRADLLRSVIDTETIARHGLPAAPGISMRVSKDGQRWYAMRRTVTGWWFAIGASGPPPSQWEYDGADPPDGYPGEDPKWGDSPFQLWPNW